MQGSEGMMGGSWGMGSGMLVMFGTLFLLIGAAVVLIMLLRRAVIGSPAELVRVGALGRLDVPSSASLENTGDSVSGEFEGFLVIPDISGYTQFMRMSAFALAHAQFVVSELLSSIIEASEGVLVAAKIEGDAVLFYGLKTKEEGQRGVTGPQVGKVIGALIAAFYRKRDELSHANACLCAACRDVDKLELKTIVHSGTLLNYDLHGQKELSGLPVIVAHRLLKSDVGLKRHVLLTDEVRQDVTLPFQTTQKSHVENYEGVGPIESTVHAFTVASLLGEDAEDDTVGPSKAKDAARKLVEGLRALRGSPGSG